ncbi:MAG: septum formation initiator family protein [Mogibacterium sp.]|nr:septum formation initiator family protein [Mogibacterium sp.]
MAGYSGTQVNRAYSGSVAAGRAATGRRSVSTGLSSGARKTVLVLIIAVGLVFLLVSLNAYAATLQYDNNVLRAENEYLQAEIDSMNSQIVEQTKVTRIEKLATGKYGMVYPSATNCITISEEEQTGESLAAMIKSEAYN